MNPSPEKNRSDVIRWIDYSMIALVSISCLQYVRSTCRNFAEISVQFSFLDFPVFIGEFVLALCLVFLIIRTILANTKPNYWHGVVFLYALFILTKAFFGYKQWGPLALRDAALFYYVMFAVVGFVSYRKEMFSGWMTFIFYAALFWLSFDGKQHEHWVFPRLFIGLALAWRISDRRWGLFMAMGILLTTPYQYFLEASRALFLGNFVAVVFLSMAVPWIVPEKFRLKILASTVVLASLLGAYSFCFSNSSQVKGLFATKELNTILMEARESIRVKQATFQPADLGRPKVYNPNTTMTVETKTQPEHNLENISPPDERGKVSSSSGMKHGNSAFRIFIWEDARDELLTNKPVFGFDFGKPFRSPKIEMVRWALDEWTRDGWIAMHNSYLNIVFRAGLVGVVLICVLVWFYAWAVRMFIRSRSLAGLLLCASLLVPLVAAFFSVTLELPYSAIPIWTLFGMMLALARQSGRQENFCCNKLNTPVLKHAHTHRS